MLKGVPLACPCTEVSLIVPSNSGLIWTLHMCLQSCTMLVLFRANDAVYVHQAMTGHTEQKSCAKQHIPDQRGMVCSTAWRSYLDWADISSWHLGFNSRAICGCHGICTSLRYPSGLYVELDMTEWTLLHLTSKGPWSHYSLIGSNWIERLIPQDPSFISQLKLRSLVQISYPWPGVEAGVKLLGRPTAW